MSISMLSREPVGVAGALLLSVLVFPATAIEVRWVPTLQSLADWRLLCKRKARPKDIMADRWQMSGSLL